MTTAADADHLLHHVPAPVPPVWGISDISLARGEMIFYIHRIGRCRNDGCRNGRWMRIEVQT